MPNIRQVSIIPYGVTMLLSVLQLGRQIWMIFLVFTSVTIVSSQIDDDFSVEILNEDWQGDRDQFVINDFAQLQLMAQLDRPVSLYRGITLDSSYQWELDIRLDFAPSGSNRLDIALIADSTDLLVANGLYIAIGENGSNDAIELYQIKEGEKKVLIRGADGDIASGAEVSLSVVYEDGFLQLSYGAVGGVKDIVLDAIAFVPAIQQAYFGWVCYFTSTRADKFFFDNIYTGAIKIDSIAPAVQEVRLNTSMLSIFLSELIDPSSVEIGSSLFINPNIAINEIEVDGNEIIVNADFLVDQQYTIDLISVMDESGNALDTTITILIPSPISPGELIINEVLFDPYDGGVDYVELYNSGSRTLQLEGLQLSNTSNGDQRIYDGPATIAPSGYAVMTSDPSIVMAQYINHDNALIYSAALPRLSNSDGNITITHEGRLIDAYDYDEDYHLSAIDDVEGISLERVSFTGDSQDPSNWASAAATVGYGTPGLENSSRLTSEMGNIRFEKRQNVISPMGIGNNTELIIDYSLDKPGYVGTVEIFDEYGSGRGFLYQNEIFATQGELSWNGRCDGGENCQVGIYILSIRLFHSDGSQYQQNVTVGVTQ